MGMYTIIGELNGVDKLGKLLDCPIQWTRKDLFPCDNQPQFISGLSAEDELGRVYIGHYELEGVCAGLVTVLLSLGLAEVTTTKGELHAG